MTRLGATIAIGVLVVTGACGGGEDFADGDPKGYEACEMLKDSRDADLSSEEKIVAALKIGALAEEAETAAIRDTTSPSDLDPEARDALIANGAPAEMFGAEVDRDKLLDACEGEGFEVD